MKLNFTVPSNKKMVKELKDYASKKGFEVKIEGNFAAADIPDDPEFQKLLLKLELAFEDELSADIPPFRVLKADPYFAIQFGNFVYIDSLTESKIDSDRYEKLINKIKEMK